MPRLRGLERAWMRTCEMIGVDACVWVCVFVRVSVPLSVVGPGPLVGEDFSRTIARMEHHALRADSCPTIEANLALPTARMVLEPRMRAQS